MSPSRAKLNRTCGEPSCKSRYLTEVGHANRGRVMPDEFRQKISAATKGRTQSPEQVAARVTARLAYGWFKDPTTVGKRISAGRTGIKVPNSSGPLNPMWQGGVWRDGPHPTRHGIDYKEWRLLVLNRASNHCELCASERFVIAHHIRDFRIYRELRTEPANGIALCRSCHTRVHMDYITILQRSDYEPLTTWR